MKYKFILTPSVISMSSILSVRVARLCVKPRSICIVLKVILACIAGVSKIFAKGTKLERSAKNREQRERIKRAIPFLSTPSPLLPNFLLSLSAVLRSLCTAAPFLKKIGFFF